jgi:hypothetical protein
MHILELILHTHHVADQKAFYCSTLGLPLLVEAPDSFTVQVGTTRLRFQETQQDVLYHVALTIPRNTFHEAKGWVQKRVPLLHKDDGMKSSLPISMHVRSMFVIRPIISSNILCITAWTTRQIEPLAGLLCSM